MVLNKVSQTTRKGPNMEHKNNGLNVYELRARMLRNGVSVKDLLEKTGIERRHFYRALEGKTTFDQTEIAGMMVVLELSPAEVVNIFLT